jgi:hypothetical protein
MAILPRAICMFSAIPIKIPMTFCIAIEKKDCEIHEETQKTWNSQNNSEQGSNTGGITIHDFKLYYRAITRKTA